MARYAQVAMDLPMDEVYHYSIPPQLAGKVRRGVRVEVPFGRGNKLRSGYCVGTADSLDFPEERLKGIAAVLDEEPLLDEAVMELARWIATYYFASWGEALSAALPEGVRAGSAEKTVEVVERLIGREEMLRKALEIGKRAPKQAAILRALAAVDGAISARDLAGRTNSSLGVLGEMERRGYLRRAKVPAEDAIDADEIEAKAPPTPTAAQEAAVSAIAQDVAAGRFGAHLLHGVTGSGKTEVYLRAIEGALSRGRSAIVLVPEISLTPQTIERFRERFGSSVAVLHSALTGGQRAEQWRRIKRGEAKVVIGARSAVFAPLPDLGVIVVDEEHESGFKQESSPRYQARDAAVVRAKLQNAVAVLGSATPALESFANAQSGKYRLLELPERIGGRALPPVEIIDMAVEIAQRKSECVISRRLESATRSALEAGGQAIYFLNRRGYSTAAICPKCRYVARCRRCDVALTHHMGGRALVCHYCGAETPEISACPECGSAGIRYIGTGTEKVEREIARLFPEARVGRMDADTTLGRRSHEKILRRFRDGDLDVLVGTQMIAKGLDFPNVTLVGIVSADTALNLPDFRAAERTFCLISQVAGRAGRGPAGGRVVVQTWNPSHYAIRAAAAHDYALFAKREMELRRERGFPPFGRLARIVVSGPDATKAKTLARRIAEALSLAADDPEVRVMGPAPAPIATIDRKKRFHVLLRAPDSRTLSEILRRSCATLAGERGLKVAVDVDPYSML